MTPRPITLTYEAFVARATADPRVLGLVLKGSQAHEGMATRHSDHDLFVVLDDEAENGADGAMDLKALDGYRSERLDLIVMSLAAFRRHALPGSPAAFDRYALLHARVVLDRLDGGTGIARLLAEKTTVSADEARAAADGWLDAYVNSLYRSLKNHRDGHLLAAHLDAADSVGYALEALFTLRRRLRPYNKFLEWELARRPLEGWDTGELLTALRQITATGDAAAQRALFGRVEAAARAAGHGGVVDSWGDSLLLLRGATG
ncbi:hypothetical protein [Streptomyces sp. ME19-01-6]|uniref:hypothetical protein n=1 Tax=Streptomyces sp. ME19-01-6 TaxID=3028686 RepID=UPI0029A409A6|nr:hypothetical protein [Streptomyces sp. ME19-01-6]MDX3226766.1 hypothetical protein [Streptomyces sp. ME19-01-6]